MSSGLPEVAQVVPRAYNSSLEGFFEDILESKSEDELGVGNVIKWDNVQYPAREWSGMLTRAPSGCYRHGFGEPCGRCAEVTGPTQVAGAQGLPLH
jgi:hypothetical protein